MLADRHYMREPSYRPQMSLTVVLLIINAAVFVLEMILPRLSHFPLMDYFALSVSGLKHGFVWQLVTYQFMHAGWLHLALNCWAIFVFGREMEIALGRQRFLTLYLTSGIIGGLAQVGATLTFPQHFGWTELFGWPTVVGASAAAFGLVAAFATMFPERTLTLLLFFILPVNMPAKFLLWGSVAIALYGIMVAAGGVAHVAHLGGILTGIFFVRYATQWPWQWRKSQSRRYAPHELVNTAVGKKLFWNRAKEPPKNLSSEEFISSEVDPILDKISAHGIQSLTERERKILEAARNKMAKR